MKELRNTHSTTVIPRTGTLVVVQIIDLAEIVAKAREGTADLGTLEGLFEVALSPTSGKTRTIAKATTPAEADAFVAGFVACADFRRARNRKASASARKEAAK